MRKYAHYNIIYSIGRAALEQAYRSPCKLGSNYIYIHLCKTSIRIKSIKNNIHNMFSALNTEIKELHIVLQTSESDVYSRV